MSKLCRYKVGKVEIVFTKDVIDEDDVGHPNQVRARSLASADAPRPAFLYDSHSDDEAVKEEELKTKLAEQREANKRDYKSKQQRKPKPGPAPQVAPGKSKSKKQLAVEQRRREKEMAEIASQLEEQAKLNEEKEEQRKAAEEEKLRREEEERQRQLEMYAKEGRQVNGERSDVDCKGMLSGSSTNSLDTASSVKTSSHSGGTETEENGDEQYVSDEDIWSEEEHPRRRIAPAPRADKQIASKTNYSRSSGQSQRVNSTSRYSYQSQQSSRAPRGRQHSHRPHHRYARPEADDSYWPGQEDSTGFLGHNQLSNQQQFNSDLPPRFKNQQANKQRREPRDSRDVASGDWHSDGTWAASAAEKGSGWGGGRGGASDDLSNWANASPATAQASHPPRQTRNSGRYNTQRLQSNTWVAALDTLQSENSQKKAPRRGGKKGGAAVVLPDELDPEPEWGEPLAVNGDDSPTPNQWPSAGQDKDGSWEVEEGSGLWKPSDGGQNSSASSWDLDIDNGPEWRKPSSRGASHVGRSAHHSAPVPVGRPSVGRGRGVLGYSHTAAAKSQSIRKDPELVGKVQKLKEMGFDEALATKALVQNDFDLESALGDLLAMGVVAEGTPPADISRPSGFSQSSRPPVTQSSPLSLRPSKTETPAIIPSNIHGSSQVQLHVREQDLQQTARSLKCMSVGSTPQSLNPFVDHPQQSLLNNAKTLSSPGQPNLLGYRNDSTLNSGGSQVPDAPRSTSIVSPDNLPTNIGGIEDWPLFTDHLPAVQMLPGNTAQSASLNLQAPLLPGIGLPDAGLLPGMPSVGVMPMLGIGNTPAGAAVEDLSPSEHARKLSSALEKMKYTLVQVQHQLQLLTLKESEVEKGKPSAAGTSMQQITIQRLRLQQYYQQVYYKTIHLRQQVVLALHIAQESSVLQTTPPQPASLSSDVPPAISSEIPIAQLLPPSEFKPLLEKPVAFDSTAPPHTMGAVSQPSAVPPPVILEAQATSTTMPMIGGRPTQHLDHFLHSLSKFKTDEQLPASLPAVTLAESLPLSYSQYNQLPVRTTGSVNSVTKEPTSVASVTSEVVEHQKASVWNGSPAQSSSSSNPTAGLRLDRAVADSVLFDNWPRPVEAQTPMSPGVFYGDGLSSTQSEPVWPSATTVSVLDSVPGVIGSNRPLRHPPGLGQPSKNTAAMAKDAVSLPSIPESSVSLATQREETDGKADGWGKLPPTPTTSSGWPAGSGWQSQAPHDEEQLKEQAGTNIKIVSEETAKPAEPTSSWPWSNWEQELGKPWPLLSPEDMSDGEATKPGTNTQGLNVRGEDESAAGSDEVTRILQENTWSVGGDEVQSTQTGPVAEAALPAGSPWLLIENITPQMEEGALRLLCQRYGTIHNFCFDRSRCAALLRYGTGQLASQAAVGLGEMSGQGQEIKAKVATDAEIGLWIQESGVFSNGSGGDRGNGSKVNGLVAPGFAPQPQPPMRSMSAPHPLPPNGMPMRPGMPMPRMPPVRMPHMWGMIPGPGAQVPPPPPMEYQPPMGGPMYSMPPAPWNIVPPSMSSVWTSRQPRGPSSSGHGSGRGFRRSGPPNRQRSEESSS